MHILIIPSWYPSSYNNLSGIFFKEQAEALSKYEHKVGVIAIQGVGIRQIVEQKKINLSAEYYLENNVHTYRKQYLDIKQKNFLKKFKMYFFIKFFKIYIKKHGLPDIVHLHSFLHGDYALWIKEKYHVPYVITEHCSGLLRNAFDKNTLLEAKRVYTYASSDIAVSHKFCDLLNKEFNINFHYIPNIVNIDFFNLKPERKENSKKFNFINVAFLDKNKNQEMLINSFSDAFSKNDNISLTIVGDGKEYAYLKKLIENLNLEKKVFLYGSASRLEVKDLLHTSDAFVLSSINETFGVVLIEAMSCGLPVVSTKCGGPESIINNSNLGLLCEIEQNDLSKALMMLYKNRLNYNSYLIREHIVNNFSEKAVVRQLNQIYKGVVK